MTEGRRGATRVCSRGRPSDGASEREEEKERNRATVHREKERHERDATEKDERVRGWEYPELVGHWWGATEGGMETLVGEKRGTQRTFVHVHPATHTLARARALPARRLHLTSLFSTCLCSSVGATVKYQPAAAATAAGSTAEARRWWFS